MRDLSTTVYLKPETGQLEITFIQSDKNSVDWANTKVVDLWEGKSQLGTYRLVVIAAAKCLNELRDAIDIENNK